MEKDTWKISFDAPDGEMCINDEIFVVDGTLSYSIEKKENDIDPLNLDSDLLESYSAEDIIIRGIFCTQHYISNIDKIETKRYVLTGIDVTKESYGSHEDRIVYEFSAGCSQVKYQVNEILKGYTNDDEQQQR